MAIGADKERLVVVTSKETKAKLEKLSQADDRSLSNYINRILENHVKESENK